MQADAHRLSAMSYQRLQQCSSSSITVITHGHRAMWCDERMSLAARQSDTIVSFVRCSHSIQPNVRCRDKPVWRQLDGTAAPSYLIYQTFARRNAATNCFFNSVDYASPARTVYWVRMYDLDLWIQLRVSRGTFVNDLVIPGFRARILVFFDKIYT